MRDTGGGAAPLTATSHAGTAGDIFHMQSELGLEKCCLACRQFWPADSEFFAPLASSRDGWTTRCKACIAERYWGRRAIAAPRPAHSRP